MPKRGVSVQSLLASLAARRSALPAEIGCFAVLEVVESMRKTRMARVDEASVLITDEGQVSLVAEPTTDERSAVRAACGLLAALLSASARAPSPQLARLSQPDAADRVLTLAALRDELEAALVPLNRQASRRVLGRMVRETEWEAPPPPLEDDILPSMEDLDSELHRLLRDSGPPPSMAGSAAQRAQSGPPPAAALPERELEALDAHLRSTAWGSSSGELPLDAELMSAAVTALPREAPESARAAPLAAFAVPAVGPAAKGQGGAITVPVPGPAPAVAAAPAAEERELVRRDVSPSILPEADPSSSGMALPLGASVPRARVEAVRPRTFTSEPPPPSGKGVWIGLVFGGLALLVVGTAFWLRPDLLTRLDTAPLPAPTSSPIAAPVVRGGDVLVRVNVERAQVLRFVGRGPATLRHVAQGMAHELVATHDGYAPARLVLPANAEWDRVDGVARYEAALQLQALATGAAVEFGESQLPRDVGAPNGRDGELRVVTTPKGAKVYELVGFAPEARVDNLPIEEVNEFLIVRPGYAPALQVVSPSDFEAQAGRSVADVGVALVPIGTR